MTADRMHRPARFDRHGVEDVSLGVTSPVAIEMPVALEFNGLGYAVLMATPADIEDLVTGFALAERLADTAADVGEIVLHETPRGLIARARLSEACLPRIVDRVRHRVSESSCGLCGIENLEQALRPLPKVSQSSRADDAAIFAALAALSTKQPGNRATGAMHAAALCSPAGDVLLVREDIGRHNAFDKLIGAMRRAGLDWNGGFALLSSRCSYELVEKAALADCPMLVTISAPTSLALDRAQEAGLRLVVLARPDAMLAAV